MGVYYCGFNGFGQFPDKSLEQIAIYHPTLFPLEISYISIAWNYLLFHIGSDAYISGFINGESRKMQQLSIPTGSQISQSSCSSKRALFVTEDGCCWMYRSPGLWKSVSTVLNVENQSHWEESERESQEKEATHVHKIVQVCCQDKLNIVLCDSGQVYSIPSVIPIPGRRVTEIACGFEHCLMLTDVSAVYSWGTGRRGQLGHGVLEDEDLPREIELLAGLRVKTVAAGGWHSVALTLSGDMYVWGWNTSGQLGMPCSETPERMPNSIKGSSSSEEGGINASMTSEGNPKGQKEIVTVQATPEPVNFPCCSEDMAIKAVACGNRHTVVLTDADEVKTKWHLLRSSYMREKRKLTNLPSGSAANDAMKISWPNFFSLQFLDPSLQYKITLGNFPNPSNARELVESFDEDIIEESEENAVTLSTTGSSEPINQLPASIEKAAVKTRKSCKRKYDAVTEIDKQYIQHLDRISKIIDADNDPDALFLRSLLPHMKKL